jgi:peptide/nickel transport system substrate-binding protein
VNVKHISERFFSDENSLALAFRSGAIDVDPYPIGNPQGFAATAATKLLTVAGNIQVYLAMNTQVAPWNDIHVRRAVAYAVNRPDLVDVIGGYGSPVFTLIHPDQLATLAPRAKVNALMKALPQYPFSVAKAKAELAKSATPNGFSYTFDEPAIISLNVVAQAIAGELAKIGINLQVKVVTTAAWVAEISGPPLTRPASLIASGSISPDPAGYDGQLLAENTKVGLFNIADYAPPAVDALVKAGEEISDPAKRFAIYGKLLNHLQTDVPYIPLYVTNNSIALSSKYTWPGLNQFSGYSGTWPLSIKPK